MTVYRNRVLAFVLAIVLAISMIPFMAQPAGATVAGCSPTPVKPSRVSNTVSASVNVYCNYVYLNGYRLTLYIQRYVTGVGWVSVKTSGPSYYYTLSFSKYTSIACSSTGVSNEYRTKALLEDPYHGTASVVASAFVYFTLYC